MNKLEAFLALMESFPSALAQPNNGFMPNDILAVAAEIREKANIPRAQMPAEPQMGAELEWRYEGDCNGCGAPILRRIYPDPEPIMTLSALEYARKVVMPMVYENPDGFYTVSPPGDDHLQEAVTLNMKDGIQFLREHACPDDIIFMKRPNGGFVMT